MKFDGKQLTWGDVIYRAKSGPWGKGQLPSGPYQIRVRHAVCNDTLADGFRAADGQRWFLPIVGNTPGRSGFGIHPDGGTPGTLGCVGIEPSDAVEFWRRWNATPMDQRPTVLDVL